jgi:hypothetical protein
MWTTAWGQTIWDSLLFTAFAFPKKPTDDEKKSVTTMIEQLLNNLPCMQCRGHAQPYFVKNPPDVTSSESLCEWVVTFHNKVNERLGKKHDWTLAEAKAALIERTIGESAELTKSQRMRTEDHRLLRKMRVRLRLLEKKLGIKDAASFQTEIDEIANLSADVIDDVESEIIQRTIQVQDGLKTMAMAAEGGVDDGGSTDGYSIATIVLLSVTLILVVAVVALVARRMRTSSSTGVRTA